MLLEGPDDAAEDGAVVPAVLDDHGPAGGSTPLRARPGRSGGPGGGAAPGQGRAQAYLATGLPGQQSHALMVSLATGEQLPAPEFLDVGHVVPIPSTPHQGLQRIHCGAADGRERGRPSPPWAAHPDLPEGLRGGTAPAGPG